MAAPAVPGPRPPPGPAPPAGPKPRVLVLGGVGMVGKAFVRHLVQHELASKIRVADKRMSMMDYLTDATKAAFASPLVQEVQVDLSKDSGVNAAFDLPEGERWDYVFHFVAETAYGRQAPVYQEKTVDTAVKCAAKAAAVGVTRFIFMSTAQVYKSSSKKPAKEEAELEPWTTPAKFMMAAEEAVRKIPSLPLVIVRPALIYGPGDVAAVTPLLVCAATYKFIDDTMKMLWDEDLNTNTVHVEDVCRALWYLTTAGATGPDTIYNLADANHTTQGNLVDICGEIFHVKTGYHGKILSNLARMQMGTVVSAANEILLKPWVDLCRENGVRSTPLTPFMHDEMLGQNHLHVDGTKLSNMGFKYKHAAPTKDVLYDVLREMVSLKIFPTSDVVLPELKPAAPAAAGGASGAAAGAAEGSAAGAAAGSA